MGVAYEPRKTSELVSWISQIKIKKTNFKCKKRKNLFVEAILSHALTSAETELRRKQQERRQRWHKLMSQCVITSNSCDKPAPNWDPKIYEEINADFDKFMNQLKHSNPICTKS
ncbi:hypothetical protein ABEB36_010282 [Hypothenemus hampei]|uniref:Uncharacterized protein n=1 Tax=Hypothenemus hampei TaxID=57062 RepID=A0ABD1EJN4_HYPHA